MRGDQSRPSEWNTSGPTRQRGGGPARPIPLVDGATAPAPVGADQDQLRVPLRPDPFPSSRPGGLELGREHTPADQRVGLQIPGGEPEQHPDHGRGQDEVAHDQPRTGERRQAEAGGEL